MFIVSSKKSSIVLTAILLTCCSPLATTTAWAMDPPPVERQSPVVPKKIKGPLLDTIELYEEGKKEEARLSFEKIYKAGGTIALAYLQNIDQKQYGPLFHDLPDYAKKLGMVHLEASLAYMTFRATPTNKKKDKLQNLCKLVLNQNAHALSLFIKLYEDQENKKIISSLPKNTGWLSKVRSVQDFYSNFKAKTEGGFPSWDCFDGAYFCETSKNFNSASNPDLGIALKNFVRHYTLNPENVGKIAQALAGVYPSQIFWTQIAIENGCPELRFKYAKTLHSVLALPSDFSEYVSGRPSKTFSEYHKTCFDLARYYLSQFSVEKIENRNEAALILNDYASIYEHGLFGERIDPTKQFFYLEKAADLGPREIQHNYAGALYRKGDTQSLEKAFKYYTLAAEQGSARSQTSLGHMYYNGQGCQKNWEQAFKWHKRSADNGNPIGQYNFATMHHFAEGTPLNLAEAVKYYTLSAAQGNPHAQCNLSGLCIAGEAVDPEKALYYAEQAALLGYAQAQHNCSALYYKKGGIENVKKALYYSEKAANQGLDYAQNFCGCILCYGEEEIQDLQKARYYLKLAAAQGNTDALIHLYVLDNLCETKRTTAMEEQSEIFEISLPLVEGAADSSDEDFPNMNSDPQLLLPAVIKEGEQIETTEINFNAVPQIPLGIPQINPDIPQIPLDIPKKPKKILSQKDEETSENLTQSQELARELASCAQQNAREYGELRLKKENAKAYQVLRLKRKDYEKTCTSFPTKMAEPIEKKKSVVSSNTMEFVKAIFGQGIKINTFSNVEAKKAFAELGCRVEHKKGENSTILTFALENDREMELCYEEEETSTEPSEQKAKYHNPHGPKGEMMYNALKPHLKRFLESIGRTPERLQVK
jgi:TPR repeat protein